MTEQQPKLPRTNEDWVRKTAAEHGWQINNQGSTGVKFIRGSVYITSQFSRAGKLTYTSWWDARTGREDQPRNGKFQKLMRWLEDEPAAVAAQPATQSSDGRLTVGQLRAALAQFPAHLPVMISVDAEGMLAEFSLSGRGPYYPAVDVGDGEHVDKTRVALEADRSWE